MPLGCLCESAGVALHCTPVVTLVQKESCGCEGPAQPRSGPCAHAGVALVPGAVLSVLLCEPETRP